MTLTCMAIKHCSVVHVYKHCIPCKSPSYAPTNGLLGAFLCTPVGAKCRCPMHSASCLWHIQSCIKLCPQARGCWHALAMGIWGALACICQCALTIQLTSYIIPQFIGHKLESLGPHSVRQHHIPSPLLSSQGSYASDLSEGCSHA